MLSRLIFVFHSYVPQVPFLASDEWGNGRLIVEIVGTGMKDYYQSI